jgi:hypothetical protein
LEPRRLPGPGRDCVFSDGSECEEWAFFRNECQPGWMATQAAAPTPAPVLDPAAAPPEGWEAYTHPTPDTPSSIGRSTFESSDTRVPPSSDHSNDETWPWITVAHPDEATITGRRGPTGVAGGRGRLPGKVMGACDRRRDRLHTRFDDPRGPQAYSDDRYYFVHDGQLYEITIMHTGKEDWAVYDRFLDSFDF